MKTFDIAIFTLLAINLSWLLTFGIRDHFKRDEIGSAETNLKIATRNIIGASINVALAILVLVVYQIMRLVS